MTRKLSLVTAALAAALTLTAVAGATAPSQANQKNAAKYCKALRASAGKDNFKTMFGGKKNAFGKCVSRAAKTDQKQEQEAKANAAKQCKAEQAQDPQAFQQKYGTGKNGKNAYGRCVAQHAKENKAAADQTDQNDVDAAKECRAEQSQDPQAFTKKYGTNANGRNAFGKCVSQRSKQKDEQGDGGGGTS